MTSTDEFLDDAEPAVAGDAALGVGDAVIPLLRGVVYSGTHTRAWAAITRMESTIRDYVRPLNLDLFVEPTEGFAYLRRRKDVEPGSPMLLRRRALPYRVSLMLALLRRQLAHLDTQGDVARLVMSREDLVEMIRTYHPERGNETRLHDAVDADVNKLVEMGFCRRIRGQEGQVEVLRVVKAFVDAEWLAEFDQRLAAYAAYALGGADTDGGEGE